MYKPFKERFVAIFSPDFALQNRPPEKIAYSALYNLYVAVTSLMAGSLHPLVRDDINFVAEMAGFPKEVVEKAKKFAA